MLFWRRIFFFSGDKRICSNGECVRDTEAAAAADSWGTAVITNDLVFNDWISSEPSSTSVFGDMYVAELHTVFPEMPNSEFEFFFSLSVSKIF